LADALPDQREARGGFYLSHEIKALIQKAFGSLEAAGLLAKEGYPNFAASRAYYAMFYAAQALLLHKGLSFSSHAAVIAAFGKEFSKSGEMDILFHRRLLDAQDSRNIGDYGLGTEITPAQGVELLGKGLSYGR
jgi:uncharacterized protein (UPF0332 family)